MKQLPVALLSLGTALITAFVAVPSARVAPQPKPKMRYTAARAGDTVVLTDATSGTVVSILPSVGNMAYEMKVHGHNVLRYPHATIEEFRKAPNSIGVPFMGPWANRLDEQAFYANGKRYPFDMALGNIRGQIPIHGFITTTDQWKVVDLKATAGEAFVTSRLEFYKQPAWMKQWPFAHSIDMTYRLKDGVLEVATAVTNLAVEPMPLVIGYHPYFQLTDSKRDEWTVSVGAKKRYLLSPQKLPTGETQPVEAFLPDPMNVPVKDVDLDDVFGDLVRDAAGARDDDGEGQGAAPRRAVRAQLQGRRGVGAEAAGRAGAQLHLLRADGRPHQRHQHGAQGHLRGTAVDRPRRDLERELLDQAERLRGRRGGVGQMRGGAASRP